MKQGTKKVVMTCIIVGCLAAAGIITYRSTRGSRRGIETVKRGQLIWVKCNNPDCGAAYQMDRRDYFEALEALSQPGEMSIPPLLCEKCGEQSVYRAVKCEKCGHLFFYTIKPGDFADRCPECGFSKIEGQRREAAKARK
jgi:predicted Zn-ribbon and HTH transcriptional regulator